MAAQVASPTAAVEASPTQKTAGSRRSILASMTSRPGTSTSHNNIQQTGDANGDHAHTPSSPSAADERPQENDAELNAVLGRTDSVLRSRKGSTTSKVSSLRRKSVTQPASTSPVSAASPASPRPASAIAPAVAQELPPTTSDSNGQSTDRLVVPDSSSDYPSANGSIGSRLR